MNLLEDKINVKEQVGTRKLSINGETKTYPVYKINLNALFYNDKNDRIATWISKYKADNNVTEINSSNIEEYNMLIENFIVESKKEAIDTTRDNIELVGQIQPGVVLKDGRVIDGNRRFTCLRQLNRKNSKYQWFEAVILDQDYENDAKQIKMLELMIQHGEEDKVKYNPIDRMVGIYQDIEETKLLTLKEYADSTGEDENSVKKQLEIAKLLVEFLETINAPKQYYIARDLDLNGPLNELYGLLQKEKDEEIKNQLKISAFTNFLVQPDEDMTRFIRNMKTIAKSPYKSSFLEEQIEISMKVLDDLPDVGQVTTSVVNQIRTNKENRKSLKDSMEKAAEKSKRDDTIHQPLTITERIVSLLEDMNMPLISKSPDKQDIAENITVIKDKLAEIEGYLNA